MYVISHEDECVVIWDYDDEEFDDIDVAKIEGKAIRIGELSEIIEELLRLRKEAK